MKPIRDLLERWKERQSLNEKRLIEAYGTKSFMPSLPSLAVEARMIEELEHALQECESTTPPVKTDGNWSEL